MDYSSLNINIENWNSFINQYTTVGVFGRADFLIATASLYNYNIDIRVILFNDKPVLALPLFIQQGKVVFPSQYFYQFIWQKEASKESWNQLEAWDFLLKQLKEKYKYVKFRMPVGFKDVRPFMWNDFSINLRYTYKKDITELNYHKNIKRILNKKQVEYTFKKNCDWDANWDFYYEDLHKIGNRKIHVKYYLQYFKKLKEQNFLQVFNAYYNGIFLTSIVAIIDGSLKIAYFPLIGTAEGHYQNGLPSLLYNYALNELKDMKIEKVDLFGANIKNIARFKSKFLPNLESFYEVHYSEIQQRRNHLFLRFKKRMGKVLFWVRV